MADKLRGGSTVGGNIIWHAGNDGTGSGLDADLLDGQSSAYYATATSVTALEAKDPVLTLAGDVTGTATFTNLGNATLTATVADDSHSHDGRYYTESESDSRFARRNGTVTSGDFNTLLTTGMYNVEATGLTNQPYTNYGTLLVINEGIRKVQVFYCDTPQGGTWTRVYQTTTWHPWEKTWTNANDGAGSGLDADLLDGQHGSYYGTAAAVALNTAKVSNIVQTTITGNASTATTLQTARTLALSGDVTGSVTFDGSANATITAVVVDDSHNHTVANVDGLQTLLDAKAILKGTSAAYGGAKFALSGTTLTITTV